jgi:hypothetical protein
VAAIRASTDQEERAKALCHPAPHLPPDLLTAAPTATRTIGGGLAQSWALRTPAPYLPEGARVEAVTEAPAILATPGNEAELARALPDLAPHLPPDLLLNALVAHSQHQRCIASGPGQGSAGGGDRVSRRHIPRS